jgi:hypothetical protein
MNANANNRHRMSPEEVELVYAIVKAYAAFWRKINAPVNNTGEFADFLNRKFPYMEINETERNEIYNDCIANLAASSHTDKRYACRQCGHEVTQRTNHYGPTFGIGTYNECPKCPPFRRPTTWVCLDKE